MDSDSLRILNDHLDIFLRNDTLVVKNFLQSKGTNSDVIETIKILFPAISTGIGVYLGYKLNNLKDKIKDQKLLLDTFKSELINLNNGTGSFDSLLLFYSRLTKKEKLTYLEVLEYPQKNASEKFDLIKRLISK